MEKNEEEDKKENEEKFPEENKSKNLETKDKLGDSDLQMKVIIYSKIKFFN